MASIYTARLTRSGASQRQIAEVLRIAPRTVARYRARLRAA